MIRFITFALCKRSEIEYFFLLLRTGDVEFQFPYGLHDFIYDPIS